MIKYIIDTTSSKRDVNGNTYHCARITSVKTGRSLLAITHGVNNAVSRVLSLLRLDWSQVYYTEAEVGYRQWQHASKFVKLQEHELTAQALKSLARKNGKV